MCEVLRLRDEKIKVKYTQLFAEKDRALAEKARMVEENDAKIERLRAQLKLVQ